MSKPKNTQVKLKPDDKDKLVKLSQSTKMDQNLIVGYLIDECIKYNMLDANWIDKLTQANYHQLLKESDLDYKKGFEVAKYKATLGTQQMLIKELVKAMPTSERISYLKNALGDPANKEGDLLEVLSTQQIYSVNGQKKMYAPGAEGSPRIVGIPPSHLKQCPVGWHILNDLCPACSRNRTCEIVFDERVDWLAIHGTHEEQENFIATSSVRRLE